MGLNDKRKEVVAIEHIENAIAHSVRAGFPIARREGDRKSILLLIHARLQFVRTCEGQRYARGVG
jgi:hypothetical protein